MMPASPLSVIPSCGPFPAISLPSTELISEFIGVAANKNLDMGFCLSSLERWRVALHHCVFLFMQLVSVLDADEITALEVITVQPQEG
jgi:hypothetical protein